MDDDGKLLKELHAFLIKAQFDLVSDYEQRKLDTNGQSSA